MAGNQEPSKNAMTEDPRHDLFPQKSASFLLGQEPLRGGRQRKNLIVMSKPLDLPYYKGI